MEHPSPYSVQLGKRKPKVNLLNDIFEIQSAKDFASQHKAAESQYLMAGISSTAIANVLSEKRTSSGSDLASLSKLHPVLVVFLRHAGCTFCRQAVADVAKVRQSIEANGVKIVFVHLGNPQATAMLLARHGFHSMETIHDADQSLYEAFGLKRGTLNQVASPRVIWRGICAGLFEGHGMGKPEGDVLQLPGVFLLDKCEVSKSFRHRSAADRPDYLAVSLPV